MLKILLIFKSVHICVINSFLNLVPLLDFKILNMPYFSSNYVTSVSALVVASLLAIGCPITYFVLTFFIVSLHF